MSNGAPDILLVDDSSTAAELFVLGDDAEPEGASGPLPGAVFHAMWNLIRPMGLTAWREPQRSRGIARICNDVTGPKTRSCVPHSVLR